MRKMGDKVTLQGTEYTIVDYQARSYHVTDPSGKKYKITEAKINQVLNKTPSKPRKPKTKTVYNFKIPNTEAEIINRLRQIEGALSPENLMQDGERPKTQAMKIARVLNAEKRELHKALGREPSFKELYNL